MGQSVELPVLKVAVSSQEFLAVSPLLIVVLYLYLHICVDDLRQRLRIFDRLHLQVAYVPFSRMLLFPSLLTMGFASQNPSVQLPSIDAELSQPTLPKTYVSSIVRLIVWGFAPLVLFLLWVRFIGEQQVVSLIPC